jgi:hypothetical protein
VFQPFVGVAPRRFMELFSMPERKDASGRIVPWEEACAELRLRNPLPIYLEVETAAGRFLEEKSVEFGIEEPHATRKDEEESGPCAGEKLPETTG